MIKHSVYFYLKEDADKNEFQTEVLKLTTIPSVVKGYVGSPAATPKRPQVEDSYDFGLVVYFNDLAGHDEYQVHPAHKHFLTLAPKFWNKVQIFDVEFEGWLST